MRKRWLLIIFVVIVGLLALAWLFPTTVYVPVGFVKGEATFDGKPTDYWVDALNQEGFLGRRPPAGDAGKTLRQGGAAAVPVLCELAQSPDGNIRKQALNALALMGAEAKAAKPMLEATLKTDANRTRFFLASEALTNIDAAAAAEAMCAILRDSQEPMNRKIDALAALHRMAPQGQEAVPTLNDIWRDPKQDPELRVEAIDVLWHMKQPPEPLIPALREMVSAKDTPVGVQALLVLGGMGPVAKSVVPTLLKVLDRPDLPLTGRRFGPPNHWIIYQTIGLIGPDASAAIPKLLGFFQGENYFKHSRYGANHSLRVQVALALANMGPAAQQALLTRDAVWATSLTLLAPSPPGNVLVGPLAEIEKRTWVPGDRKTTIEVLRALYLMDPDANRHAGLPVPIPHKFADDDNDD
jgi:HEAT repeat protein